MKKKIGKQEFEVYPVPEYGLNGFAKIIYPMSISPDICPNCGRKLVNGYTFVVQISNTTCVRIKGWACIHCEAFYAKEDELLSWLRVKKYNRGVPAFSDVFYFNVGRNKSIFWNNATVFRQYILLSPNCSKVISVTKDYSQSDKEAGVIHYFDALAMRLWECEHSENNEIIIDDKKYIIAKINKKRIDANLENAINRRISNGIVTDDGFLSFSTATTIYVYRGNTACHRKHHMVDIKAIIPCLDQTVSFYAEYCADCNKYLIKYQDYEKYLKRFQLFPIKVSLDSRWGKSEFSERAEKSPLMLNGYSVNQESMLTQEQRQRILAYIMDYGILSKRKVLNYLEGFIATNCNRHSFDLAVAKWEKDKEFVLNHFEKETPLIVFGKVERRT